jgi:alginate O-acetyltransferase complex protein AlgI
VVAVSLKKVKFSLFIGSLDDAPLALVYYLEVVRGGLNIYFQFSGFADVAIGFSLLLGYRVMENFNWPYLQKNIAAFWRCWHISLTSWCRDYVYLPTLGVTRNPIIASYSTFMVIGLWHEISLRYVLWALYHATGVLIWRGFQRLKRRLRLPRIRGGAVQTLVDGISILSTVHFVWFGLVIVRQPKLSQAGEVFKTVFLFWL